MRPLMHVGVGAAAIACTVGTPALAQDSARPTGEAEASDNVIVVTARKREESLQEVPVSISAVGGAALERQQLSDPVELSGFVPNLFLKQNPTTTVSSSIYIRGIGQEESHFTQEPGVGLYIDGVFYSRASGSITELVEIERIEVLRGPQGTLFGRNSPAGAISIVTRAPKLDESGGRVAGTLGNFSLVGIRGSGNVVLVEDKLAVKFDFLSRNQDGYMRNGFEQTGVSEQTFNGIDKQAARASILWQPTSQLSIRVTGDYSRDRSDMYAPTFVSADEQGNVTLVNGDPFLTFVRPEFSLPAVFDGYGLTGTIDYEIDENFAIKYLGAYRDYRHFLAGELFGAEAFPLGLQRDQEGYMNQQELQLNYTSDRVQFVTGAIYYRDVAKEEAFNPFAGGANLYPISRQTTDSYAVYGEGTVSVIDTVRLTVGGRYSYDKKRLVRASTELPDLQGETFAFDMDETRTTSRFTPRVILDWRPIDNQAGVFSDLMLYASWSEGYKVGAFSPGFTDDAVTALTFLEPELVTTYEGGFKAEFFDSRARLNATYFYTEYNNLQQRDCQFATPTGCVPLGLDVVLQGLELEGFVEIADGLSINAALATLDSDYQGPAPGSDRLPNTPELTYRLGADYRTSLGNGGQIFAGAVWRWTDEFEQVFASAPQTRTPAFGLLSANVGYETPDGMWTFQINAENLTDETFIANAIGGGNLGAQWYGRPREVSFTVGVEF